MESRAGAGAGAGAARGVNGAATPAPVPTRAKRKKAKAKPADQAQAQQQGQAQGQPARPIPQPYLARAPRPIASYGNYDPLPSSSNLVLPSSFRRTVTSSAQGGGDPGPSTVRNTERERFANGLLAPPTIRAGTGTGTGGGAARRRPATAAAGGIAGRGLGLGAGNPSMTSLGYLGRILESDLTATGTGAGADTERANQATPAPARRRRQIVRGDGDEVQGETPSRRLTVSSREEGRAIGLARGASMRRLNVWDDLPENNDAPPPFPFPTTSTSRLPPTFQSTQTHSIPSSPPPTFAQATGLEPLPHLPILSEEPETTAPTVRPTSRASTRYMSAPSSPVLTALESVDDPELNEEERSDRRMWNADLLAGYSLEERVKREMDRNRARDADVGAGVDDSPAREDTIPSVVASPVPTPVAVAATLPPVTPSAEPIAIPPDETTPVPTSTPATAEALPPVAVEPPAIADEPAPTATPTEEAIPVATKKVKGKGKAKVKAKRRASVKVPDAPAMEASVSETPPIEHTTSTSGAEPQAPTAIDKPLPASPTPLAAEPADPTATPAADEAVSPVRDHPIPGHVSLPSRTVDNTPASLPLGRSELATPPPIIKRTEDPPAPAPASAHTPEPSTQARSSSPSLPRKASAPIPEPTPVPTAASTSIPARLGSTRNLATLTEHVESPPLSAEDRVLGEGAAESGGGPGRKLTRGKAIRRSSSGLIKGSDSPTASAPLFSAARFDFGKSSTPTSSGSGQAEAGTSDKVGTAAQPRPFIHRSSAPEIPQISSGGRRLGDPPSPTLANVKPKEKEKKEGVMPAHREAALLRRESILAHFARPAPAPAPARQPKPIPKARANSTHRLSLPSGPLIDFSDFTEHPDPTDPSVSPSSSNFRSLVNANTELLQLLEDQDSGVGEASAESSAQAAAKAELVKDIRAQLQQDLPPWPAQSPDKEPESGSGPADDIQATIKKKPPPPPPPLRTKKGTWTAGQKISIVDTASSPITPRPSLRRPAAAHPEEQTSPTAPRPTLPSRRPPPPPPRPLSVISGSTSTASSITSPPPRLAPPIPPRPWKRFDRDRPRGPRPPPPPPRPRTWAKVVADSGPPDDFANDTARPGGERQRTHSAETVPIHLDAPASQSHSSMRSVSEQDLTSSATGSGRPRPVGRRRPTPEYTDLDVFVSRLEGSGREYEGYSHIAQFLGPAKSPAASSDALSTLLPGPVIVESRRTTREGKVKLKLSLLGVRVTKCPICLAQFRENDLGVLLPLCGHLGHESCAKRWFREDDRCFVCRVKLKAPEGVV